MLDESPRVVGDVLGHGRRLRRVGPGCDTVDTLAIGSRCIFSFCTRYSCSRRASHGSETQIITNKFAFRNARKTRILVANWGIGRYSGMVDAAGQIERDVGGPRTHGLTGISSGVTSAGEVQPFHTVADGRRNAASACNMTVRVVYAWGHCAPVRRSAIVG